MLDLLLRLTTDNTYIFANLLLQIVLSGYTLVLLRGDNRLHSLRGYASFLTLALALYELLAWTQLVQFLAIFHFRDEDWYFCFRNAYWTIYWVVWAKHAIQYVQWRYTESFGRA
jgi:hypothetical protein